jgi:hypothetical protein
MSILTSIFMLPGSMILIGAALYAFGSMKRDPFRVYLIPPHALVMLGGTLVIIGFTVLTVVYFKSPR